MILLAIHFFIQIAVSVLPVFVFLSTLVFLDSYKLVRLSSIVFTILLGCFVAGVCLFTNNGIMNFFAWNFGSYSRYGAPVVEEFFKAIYLVYLLKSKKIGFMVDAAIYGFAIGAGFAFIENIYYLQSLPSANLILWIIRGFGTAVMHAGTTAMFGVIAKNFSDRYSSESISIFLPGLALAIVTHSFFNNFFLSPRNFTIIILIVLPPIMMIIFNQSEKATRDWLGVGFDTDMELFQLITTGNLSESKIGVYLQSLKSRFPGEVVADMLCLLRIHVELSMRAKGILMMRETGFRPASDPETREKFEELKYLEKSIGKTGQLAIAPFLHTSSRDLWQLTMLGKK